MNLQSYVCGAWATGREAGVAMRDATTGEIIANASSAGIDFAARLGKVLTTPAGSLENGAVAATPSSRTLPAK